MEGLAGNSSSSVTDSNKYMTLPQVLVDFKCHKGFQGTLEDLGWNIPITKVKPSHLDYPDFTES